MTEEEPDVAKKDSKEGRDLFQKIINIEIEDQMKDAYLAYAMSVIVGRALPDVRDGLKIGRAHV